jgi:predicted aldo/keto reductase-like oxidoreductase
MLYRKMNKAAPELSILGFGCMRLPVKENGQIDEERATGMIRYAIDNGVNYVTQHIPITTARANRLWAGPLPEDTGKR